MSQLKVIKKMLGENFLEDLSKTEVFKPMTQTVVDHEELASALKIVPRIVMSWLTSSLIPMKEGDSAEFELPFAQSKNSKLEVKKLTADVYSGSVIKENKVVNKFLYRTIPGIGLILLTTFEMYEMEKLDKDQPKAISDFVQSAVEEKMKLKDLVEKVVDKKLSERDAIESLVLAKINSSISEKKMKSSDKKEEDSAPEKGARPLKKFLDKRNKKKHSVPLAKSEVCCPDCGGTILKSDTLTPCICYGENRNSKISLKKTDSNYILTFSNSWDRENIEMILDLLRKEA